MLLTNLPFRETKKPLPTREEAALLSPSHLPYAIRVGWNWHLATPEAYRSRLPWLHRASPSATHHEIRYINGYG